MNLSGTKKIIVHSAAQQLSPSYRSESPSHDTWLMLGCWRFEQYDTEEHDGILSW